MIEPCRWFDLVDDTVSRWFPWKMSETKVTYFQFLKVALTVARNNIYVDIPFASLPYLSLCYFIIIFSTGFPRFFRSVWRPLLRTRISRTTRCQIVLLVIFHGNGTLASLLSAHGKLPPPITILSAQTSLLNSFLLI